MGYSLYPGRGRQSGGAEPRERDGFLEFIIYKIGLKHFKKSQFFCCNSFVIPSRIAKSPNGSVDVRVGGLFFQHDIHHPVPDNVKAVDDIERYRHRD